MASVAGYALMEFVAAMGSVYVLSLAASVVFMVRMSLEARFRGWYRWLPLVSCLFVFALLLLPARIGTLMFLDGVLVGYIVRESFWLWKVRGAHEEWS